MRQAKIILRNEYSSPFTPFASFVGTSLERDAFGKAPSWRGLPTKEAGGGLVKSL
jgi:hypothetical protein